MKKTLYQKVTIGVETDFGPLNVVFTIVDILPNNFYVLLAQKRIVIGKYTPDNSWELSKPVDLLNIGVREGVYSQELSSTDQLMTVIDDKLLLDLLDTAIFSYEKNGKDSSLYSEMRRNIIQK